MPSGGLEEENVQARCYNLAFRYLFMPVFFVLFVFLLENTDALKFQPSVWVFLEENSRNISV